MASISSLRQGILPGAGCLKQSGAREACGGSPGSTSFSTSWRRFWDFFLGRARTWNLTPDFLRSTRRQCCRHYGGITRRSGRIGGRAISGRRVIVPRWLLVRDTVLLQRLFSHGLLRRPIAGSSSWGLLADLRPTRPRRRPRRPGTPATTCTGGSLRASHHVSEFTCAGHLGSQEMME